jgi:hypothetical protein
MSIYEGLPESFKEWLQSYWKENSNVGYESFKAGCIAAYRHLRAVEAFGGSESIPSSEPK